MKKRLKAIIISGLVIFFSILFCWLILTSQKKNEYRPSGHFGKLPTGENYSKPEISPEEKETILQVLHSQISVNKDKCFFEPFSSMKPPSGRRIDYKDIDSTYKLITDKGNFLIKLNIRSELEKYFNFEYEKESLQIINEVVPNFAPYFVCLGKFSSGKPFLVVSFLPLYNMLYETRFITKHQISLAKNLAQLHQKKSPNGKFGFHIGKNNQWKDSWEKFFLENRWQPLWKRIYEKYPQDTELKKWEIIIRGEVIPDLLGNLPVEPVLLHGNLSFDSFLINSLTDEATTYDPQCYYGHNEVDLAYLCSYFYPHESPEKEFFAEYWKIHPQQTNKFEERKLLYQLYEKISEEYLYFGTSLSLREECLTMMKKLAQIRPAEKII